MIINSRIWPFDSIDLSFEWLSLLLYYVAGFGSVYQKRGKIDVAVGEIFFSNDSWNSG